MPDAHRTASDVLGWLDLYDRVVASAEASLVTPAVTAEVRAIGERVRRRRAFDGLGGLVGLAGGTGSGKSSLLNALAGEEVSPAGAQRPTTSRAVAWVPESLIGPLENWWARLPIETVLGPSGTSRLVVIDLPDLDSVEGGHREAMIELVSDLDLVVWVLDPEKYRDRVLHDHFLRPLILHSPRFLFALNQIDRLSDGDLSLVRTDLVRVLNEDGYSDPWVLTVAADPVVGPPIGIEELWEWIKSLAALEGGVERARAELARGMRILKPHAAALGFARRWEETRRRITTMWGRSPAGAIRELRDFVQELSLEANEIDPLIDVEELIGSTVGQPIDRHLDATVGRYLRDQPRPRATTRALLTELSLALDQSSRPPD
ncbi:MAG: GTPase [Actinomycetota bacterium]